MPSRNEFADLLNEVLGEQRWSQSRLARELKVSRSTVSRWLSGEKAPDQANLTRLADRLNIHGERRAHLVSTWLGAPIGHHARPSLAPPVPLLPPHSRMPLHRNALFSGREAQLATLTKLLAHPGATVIVAGMGGLGKTQLACEFVYRSAAHFPGGVFWISCADPAGVPEEVAACGGAGHLNLRPHFESLSLATRVALVEAAWRQPQLRLLIFDNCEDEVLLRRWRPVSGGCRVLVTGRRMQWDVSLRREVLLLPLLNRAESIALLRRHRPDLAEDDPVLSALADALGDLPLALHLAGHYLARRRRTVTPAMYLGSLSASAGGIDIEHPSLATDGSSPTGRSQSLVSTFVLSLARLRSVNPTDAVALHLLSRVAWFAPGEPVPLVLLQAALDEQAVAARVLDDALERLADDLGLIDIDAEGAVRMHRLLAAFVRGSATEPTARAAVEQALLAQVGALIERDMLAPPLWLRHLRVVALATGERTDDSAVALFLTLGRQLWFYEDEAAIPYLEQALARCELTSGRHCLMMLECLNALALGLHLSGAYKRAQLLLERAVGLAAVEAPGSERLAQSLNNLGYLLLLQGDYRPARERLAQALMLRRRIFGLRHPQTARSIHNLGFIMLRLGRYYTARRYLLLALRIREQILEPENKELALTCSLLGEVHTALGLYPQAWYYHRCALALYELLFGPENVPVAESLRFQGRLLVAEGRYAEARQVLERALAMIVSLATLARSDVPALLEDLGRTLRLMGDYAGAQARLEEALGLWIRHYGAKHPYTAGACYELGLLHHLLGDEVQAREYLERALVLRIAAFGPEHREVRAVRRELEGVQG